MENDVVTIRYANAGDNLLLAEMGARTFYTTFAAENTPENMATFLAATYSPELQAAELADPTILILIAEIAGAAVGYATLRTSTRLAGITGERPLEIGRLYAEQGWIGRGIGKALMQAVLQEAQTRGHDTVWLGVWERNAKARAFYQKWGFVEVGTHIFTVGDDRQTDLLMQRSLT